MPDYNQQIKTLEEELKKTKYNKATQGHFAIVKAKIAMLREKQESRVQRKVGKSEHGYSVRKSGDATVLLLGFPSTGKSTLLNALTGAHSEVAAYAFTTLSVIPGMLEYKQASIQILDVPGVVEGAASGRGRGKEVLAVIRNADLVLIVVDVLAPQQFPTLLKEIREADIRINRYHPEVYIKKTSKGGILIGKTVPLEISDDTIRGVLREFKINNAEVLIRSRVDIDDFIDCIEGNKKYLPAIICVSKADTVDDGTLKKVMSQTQADLAVSATTGFNLEEAKEFIFRKLNFIRIYMKEPKKEADVREPLIITSGSTVGDICNKLHRDFQNKFKFARIWGSSAKFPGQRLMLHHSVQDKDIVEIHVK